MGEAQQPATPTPGAGWPDRLYLIGRDGRVAFQGDQGPFGFRPEQLEEAILAEA